MVTTYLLSAFFIVAVIAATALAAIGPTYLLAGLAQAYYWARRRWRARFR